MVIADIWRSKSLEVGASKTAAFVPNSGKFRYETTEMAMDYRNSGSSIPWKQIIQVAVVAVQRLTKAESARICLIDSCIVRFCRSGVGGESKGRSEYILPGHLKIPPHTPYAACKLDIQI
jgi:hypothetical protein